MRVEKQLVGGNLVAISNVKFLLCSIHYDV